MRARAGRGGGLTMGFNMNRTWSQATQLVRANFQLLAVIAGVFLLLPALVFALVMPNAFDLMALGGDDPEAIQQAMAGMLGPILVYGLIGMVLQLIGYAAMVALIGQDRPTVGEAIMLGLRILLPLVAALLLFLIGYLAIATLASLLVGGLAALLGGAGGGGLAAILGVLLFAVLFAAAIYAMTRLLLTLPVIALEGERNPITALRRSWALSAPHRGAIFGFFVLLFIAYVVISVLLLGFTGVIAAALGGGTGAAFFTGLVNGLIGALVAMVMSAILVAMHRQLAGRSPASIGEAFK